MLSEGTGFFVYPFRVIFLENRLGESDPPVQFAISVRKKQFKRAVKRNLIKRRTREAWRKQKATLYGWLENHNKNLIILFVYGADVALPYAEIYHRIGQIIKRLETELERS